MEQDERTCLRRQPGVTPRQHVRVCVLISALIAIMFLTPAVAGEVLTGKVVEVADGDSGVLKADGREFRFRLAQIDAPERDQDWSSEARRALIKKVYRKSVEFEVTAFDKYGRLVGKIRLGDRDINREMIRQGHAWAYRQFMTDGSLLEDERRARDGKLGVWRVPDPRAPWRYRRGDRSPTPISRKYYYGGGARPSRIELPGDFSCGSKTYCSQMTSCKEARFHLTECGLVRLDGDGDGVPCEKLCR